ncbi:hypothetical protein [Candidatus Electronema sp. PJ]|uniref:hypothetical protein n=1 Tax=Candidatus Electronema sp. PJ TaxID=3401572 RepID=UPI003AA8AF96
MTTAFPYPAKENGYLAEHVNLLRTCLHTLTGRELLEQGLPLLNGQGSKKGVYEIELSREGLGKAAPLLPPAPNSYKLNLRWHPLFRTL